MKDRLIFKKTKLKNGIHVYSRPMDVPFAAAWIYIPVGHFHNTGDVIPGTAHFLEHLVYERSYLYPEKDQFHKLVELKGGDFNASTGSLQTEYKIATPADIFDTAFKGLMSHVFDPIIKDGDIPHEASVISNEAKQVNKWYPGSNDLENHIRTKWKYHNILTNRQKLGSGADHKKMTATKILDFHKAYFDTEVYVIVGGTFDEKMVLKELGRIKTQKHTLPIKFNQVRWKHREYHEKKFENITRFQYRIGGIFSGSDMETKVGVNFIGKLLTNSVHGVLMEWLRNDLGWCYEIDFEFNVYVNPYMPQDWELFIPLNSRKQVTHVRKELHSRILKAISDTKLLALEVERQNCDSIFYYQTLHSIMDDADTMLGVGGQIYNEAEYAKILEKCKNPAFLKEIYDKYFSPQVVGEFLAVPK